ncbi:hypothetical protein R0K18_34010, partial [Pantoea sp. SIMBA_133]
AMREQVRAKCLDGGTHIFLGRIIKLICFSTQYPAYEIQLTDAIEELRVAEGVDAYRMQGTTYDCGHQLGYLEAILAYGRRH